MHHYQPTNMLKTLLRPLTVALGSVAIGKGKREREGKDKEGGGTWRDVDVGENADC